MNRNTRTFVVFLLSMVVAGIATAVLSQVAQRTPAVAAEVRSQPVAVAARALPAGARLTADDVRLIEWPAANPIKGSVSRLEDAVNRGLLAAVVENEPLTTAKLASAGWGAGLPPMIADGMRAISVKVDDVVGVAGFAEPGAHVDVVVTINQRDESVARVVVSNVQVLAAGTRADQGLQQAGKVAPSAAVVTLLVSPADAERISLASSIGRIMLTLRHPLDASTPDTTGTRMASLLGAPEAPPPSAPRPPVTRAPRPAAPEPPPPPPPPYTVETIRAAKRTAEIVK